MLHRGLRTHLDQAALLTANRPQWANGIRGAIATVGPIVAATALRSTAGIWLGLAGFNVALSDKGGPGRTRPPRDAVQAPGLSRAPLRC